MSIGGGKSSSDSKSKPLNPEQLEQYYTKLDELSGGRLKSFAATGSRPVSYSGVSARVNYSGLSPAQLESLGGAGAMRTAETNRARTQAIDEITADPNLSVAQRQRARQLTDDDYNARLDAISKETEALLSEYASTDAGRKLEADSTNVAVAQEEARRRYLANLEKSQLTSKDLEMLANIFFGGKGQTSSSSSNAWNLSAAFTPKPGG